jgi:hypothetical protein
MPDDDADTTAPDLSTVTTDELVAELKRRHDCCLFIGEIDRTVDDVTWCRYTHGSYSRIIGMMERAKSLLLRKCEEAEDDESEDDDDD